ncbi:MAG: 3-oxoadipate enol-lactonase [Pseudonocardiales bacterium]|nr:3-oxoadipate enol-lactonase [Pseudonocardiales bacterium]
MTVALHHVSDGPADGPVLVMAGSLGSTTEMWRPQLPALAEHFRVVRIDLRGHGGSPATAGPYEMDALADDVLALLDRLDLRRVHWCGLSLGAMVGMYLASETPERIDRLALCCTSAYFPDPGVWRERILSVDALGTAGIATAVVARWFTAGWAAEHPDAVAEAEAMVASISDEGYSGCCAALAVWDHRDRLPAITAPTLVVAGADDPATPVEPHATTLAAGIPGARLEVVPGGHLATIESAETVNALLLAHLADRAAAPR